MFTVNVSNGNGALTYPVGLITTDELLLGGSGNSEYLGLNNTILIINPNIYLSITSYWFWTMTPAATVNYFAIMYRGSAGCVAPNDDPASFFDGGVRPVISLKPDAITGGDGTMNNPFIVG